MTSQRPGGLSVIEQLAGYVATEAFDKLPEAAVGAARRAILDTLGVTLAGAVEPTAARVRALIAHRRAADEATVIGTPLRAAVEDALDYDDLNQSLAGPKANFGTDCKPLHVGHAARCGIEAALLAEAGFTGNPRVLEHGDGFGATHVTGNRPAWDLTTAGLGSPHDLVDPGIGVKRFPACASTHQALDATLALAEEHAIDPAAVVAVECGVNYMAPHQLIYDQAETGLQGKFSMPYCVSVALLDRTVGLAQFAEERVRRSDVKAFMPKVRMFVHPDQTSRESLPTRFTEVAIELADGRRLVKRVRLAKGQPQHPLSDAELTTKFHDCAARVLSRERAESVLAAVQTLEIAPDVSALARLLTGNAR